MRQRMQGTIAAVLAVPFPLERFWNHRHCASVSYPMIEDLSKQRSRALAAVAAVERIFWNHRHCASSAGNRHIRGTNSGLKSGSEKKFPPASVVCHEIGEWCRESFQLSIHFGAGKPIEPALKEGFLFITKLR